MSVRAAAAARVVQGAEHAQPYLRVPIEALGAVDDPWLRYDIVSEAGRCASAMQDWTEAFRYHRLALDVAQALREPMLVAVEYNELAWMWALRGQPGRAMTHAEQALALLSTAPPDPLLAPVLHTYGAVLEKLGRNREAMDVYQEALDAAAAHGNEHGQATYHEAAGDLAQHLGADDAAARHRSAAADIYDAIGMPAAAQRARDAVTRPRSATGA